MTRTDARAVITAWATASPFGLGNEAFSRGLAAGAVAVASTTDPAHPALQIAEVPDFDAREALGRKGTRSMDRVTALTVATVGRLLSDRDGERLPEIAEQTGLVLGTTTGSAHSMLDFTRESLTQKRPYFVDPTKFPNTVMNCAAGQSAIWHRLRGPNTTIASGRTSALSTLAYAARLQRSGRVGQVICGAAEEMSATRAWLTWHQNRTLDTAPLGEGCGLFLLEPEGTAARAGRRALADVLAVNTAVSYDAHHAVEALGRCMEQTVPGDDRERLWLIAWSEAPGDYAKAEEEAVASLFAHTSASHLYIGDHIGDTGAASAAFQVAAVLARAEAEPSDRARLALVNAVDRDGTVASALLRIRPTVQ
ncbi:beta-ketoacyl synthase N-terminal-like domain-containing protein [Glycomyces halotolerans]